MTSYWFTSRPKEVEHQHPFLVFDGNDRLHLPLTIFGKEASDRLSPKTIQTYLHAVLPFFAWLDTDVWQLRAGKWNGLKKPNFARWLHRAMEPPGKACWLYRKGSLHKVDISPLVR